jgi:hypothetical protein
MQQQSNFGLSLLVVKSRYIEIIYSANILSLIRDGIKQLIMLLLILQLVVYIKII